MSSFFAVDGPVITILTKVGQLIILTVLMIVCSLPIITMASSGAAFYYAVIKSVRREVGYPVREFFASMKRTLKEGMVVSMIIALCAYLLYININYITNLETGNHLVMYLGTLVIAVLLLSYVFYLFPVMSRFSVGIKKWFKMSFFLMFFRLPYTVLITISFVGCAWVTFFYLPVAMLLIIPGFWCYGITFLMEPALKRYMPKPKEGEEKQWYDE